MVGTDQLMVGTYHYCDMYVLKMTVSMLIKKMVGTYSTLLVNVYHIIHTPTMTDRLIPNVIGTY